MLNVTFTLLSEKSNLGYNSNSCYVWNFYYKLFPDVRCSCTSKWNDFQVFQNLYSLEIRDRSFWSDVSSSNDPWSRSGEDSSQWPYAGRGDYFRFDLGQKADIGGLGVDIGNLNSVLGSNIFDLRLIVTKARGFSL